MISVSNLEKGFGDRTLFAGASFQLNPGERYGLVGANGSGKTTLLNVLCGTMEPTHGQVSVPKSLRLGVLKQDHFAYENEEILGVALMGNPELWHALAEKEAILSAGEDNFDYERFSELEETIQRLDGYTAEARAATILEGLGLPTEVHRAPLSTLSGGFKLRVLLAQVLASDPDVLLLDEPTNHLDIISIRWLEKFLEGFRGPVVIISHDHRFLDNVSTQILDVDYGTVTLYRGNYSQFLEAKVAERERREKEIASREKEIAHHQQFVDRFRAKASKARQAQSKLRFIEKKAAELTELPGSSRRYPTFRFEPRRPSGKEVLKVKGVHKAFGDNEVLHGVDLEVRRGDRLAIMGPNGIGKSTLLKIVMGEVGADMGEVTWGYETHPGYFAQDNKNQFAGGTESTEEWLWAFCPGRDRGFVRGQMGLMLFSGDDGKKKVSALSGGEAARLVFARLGLDRPNVLVLDEPTNHLDLESIEALVAALREYDGTLIFVSHDRWFVSQLATRIVEIKPGEVTDYLGTYEEYVHVSGNDHLDADTVILKARREKRQKARERRASRTSQVDRSPADIEKEIRRLERDRDEVTASLERDEARVAEIDAAFCEAGFYDRTTADEVSRLESERSDAQHAMDVAMERWSAIEARLEALSTSS
ncbi:MAG: ABC-F family ATP-binding cassette domain-containing protein [Gemmatimonadota bacterium]|nr:ABC-F family ATP-binding cassette domain-containing protein [Gemmatimonadota bacterium]MDE3006909.1 ABC-F family ATP-binding cassette domain-containing protein [Gemmatimonadota bacterium]MDE3013536.1 ABC-F family ATP-binding cassette domain-containing protein [Gemmatimonadota bacterium]